MATKPKSIGKDTPAMVKKELNFMVKNKAPKAMIKHEKAEYKMKTGKK